MSHGIRHFHWRDGRPRWIADRTARDLGFKGKDLKDEEGNWMALRPAMAAAERINAVLDASRSDTGRISRRSPTDSDPDNMLPGYVYFIWAGNRVKVGFSANPFSRLSSLKTSISSPIEKFIVVPGTMAAEQRLHRRFEKHHSHGEWFKPTKAMEQVIARMLIAGTADLP